MSRLAPLLLIATLTACASVPHGVRPSETTWYVQPAGTEAAGFYKAPSGASDSRPLYANERYVITSFVQGRWFRVRTASGARGYLYARSRIAPVRYNPAVHPTGEALARIERQHSVCASFATQSQAQAAFVAGQSQLDGDGDGRACEHLRTAPVRTRTASPSASRSSKCHWVRGYTRRDGTRVRGHRRCR
ncbi:MAG: hypothetical protein AAF791_04540 [Bacteroidota bacterium]